MKIDSILYHVSTLTIRVLEILPLEQQLPCMLYYECHCCCSSRRQGIGRHGMMTSSNGNIFRVPGLLCGEFPGHWWNPRTKASDAELWCNGLNKWLSKQSWGWRFETPSRSLWRHCNGFAQAVSAPQKVNWKFWSLSKLRSDFPYRGFIIFIVIKFWHNSCILKLL